ncbi:anti-sigma factor family protein [Nonomuraea lactucae]|uniref:anti-sigma factor family protein n=1 Tax=Nonomuraea lactucae TaxID=2249762 RepID=UPI000DE2D0AD|nr:zf-HC2 domain-containing protein [Nonomuraea lactucae]
MNFQVEHTDVGAYALGLLEEDDKRAFEAHLYVCPSCRAELADLAGVAGALDGLGPLDDEPAAPRGEPAAPRGEAEVVDMMRRRRAADRRTRRGTVMIGLAAAVTLVAGGLTVGMQVGSGGMSSPAASGMPSDAHMGPAEQFYADGRPVAGTGAGGVNGGLVVESKAWGTHAALKLAGVKGPLECELVSVSKSGVRRVMTGWSVPAAGYGVPGQPRPLYMHGGSPSPLHEIDRFEVVTTTGKKLLTVEV